MNLHPTKMLSRSSYLTKNRRSRMFLGHEKRTHIADRQHSSCALKTSIGTSKPNRFGQWGYSKIRTRNKLPIRSTLHFTSRRTMKKYSIWHFSEELSEGSLGFLNARLCVNLWKTAFLKDFCADYGWQGALVSRPSFCRQKNLEWLTLSRPW